MQKKDESRERKILTKPEGSVCYRKNKNTNFKIAKKVSEESGIAEDVVRHILSEYEKAIMDSLKRGEDVIMYNFGAFKLKYITGRYFYNGTDMEAFFKPAHYVVRFKPTLKEKKLIEKVKVEEGIGWKPSQNQKILKNGQLRQTNFSHKKRREASAL